MLMTMEHAYNEELELFPSPERIDKVQESMRNLEEVVRERNEAYHYLETGETGEQPSLYISNILGTNIKKRVLVTHSFECKFSNCVDPTMYIRLPGIRQYYRLRQHLIPKFLNSTWKKTHHFGYNGYAVRKFLKLYREKLWNAKRIARKYVFSPII